MTPEKLLKFAQKGNAYIAGKDGKTAENHARELGKQRLVEISVKRQTESGKDG